VTATSQSQKHHPARDFIEALKGVMNLLQVIATVEFKKQKFVEIYFFLLHWLYIAREIHRHLVEAKVMEKGDGILASGKKQLVGIKWK